MIFAQKGDTLADIIGRVMESADREVSVVIPFGFEAVRSEEDFFRLFEEARAAGKIVSILSDDEHVRVRAKHIGFRVGAAGAHAGIPKEKIVMSDIVRRPGGFTISLAPKPQQEKSKPKAPQKAVQALVAQELQPQQHRAMGEQEPILEPPRRFLTGLSSFRIPAFFRSSLGLTLVLTLAGLGIAAGVFGIVLPSVTVDIIPRTEELDVTMELVAAVNAQEGEIPAQLVSVEKSIVQKAKASERTTSEARAHGTVKIYNAFGPDTQTLVATTRLLSEGGKLFRTVATVVVPAAKVSGSALEPAFIEAQVIAAEPGSDYNIGPATFSIPGFQGTPKYQGFYGKSDELIRGGASGEVFVIAPADIEKATEGLEARAQEEIEKDFTAKLPAGFMVLNEARVRSIVIGTDAEAGDPAEEVTATADAKVEALLFQERDVLEQAEKLIRERLGEDIQILPQALTLNYAVRDRSFDRGRMVLDVSVVAGAARRINEKVIAQAIAGKSEPEIRSFLGAHEDVKFAKVRFSPFFISRAPKDPARITVLVSLDTK